MAIVTSSTGAAFDNLGASVSSSLQRSDTSLTIGFTPEGGKQLHSLKLSGQFGASGQPTALDQALLTLPDASTVTIAFPFGLSNLALDLSGSSVRVDRLLEQLLADGDLLNLGDLADTVNAGGGNDSVQAGGGNDRIRGGAGDDAINGGSGIDTAIYAGARAGYQIAAGGSGYMITDRSGAEGTDTLTAVERLRFADVGVALDLAGHAGVVAKLLGAVFGAKSVGNREYVGIGLSLLDQGMGTVELASLAMSVTGLSAPADVVALLWTHVVGSAPTAAQAQPFVDMLRAGTSAGQLAWLAAETALNAQNIDLVGLAKTGLDFA